MMRPSDLKSDRLSCDTSDNECWDLQTWSDRLSCDTSDNECWDLQTWSDRLCCDTSDMLRLSDLKSDRLSCDTSDMLRPSDLKSDRLSCDTSDMLRPSGWVVILVICWDLQTWSDRLSCDTIDMLRPSDLIHTYLLLFSFIFRHCLNSSMSFWQKLVNMNIISPCLCH